MVFLIPKMSNLNMKCPKCGSEKLIELSSSFPHTLECKECGYIFHKLPKLLIDE
jgi:uncharacterized Zn finger protein